MYSRICTEAAAPPAGAEGAAGAGAQAAALQQATCAIALGFTPRVTALDEAVLLDVTGSLRLFGGLAQLTAALLAQLAACFAAQQQVVQTLHAQGATSLVALGRLRFRRARPDAGRIRIAELPMDMLSAARPHLPVLERIGCRTWDDVLRLPRDGMARRFDAALLEALDRARGQAPDDYVWQVLPVHFEERLELDALVEQAPALMAGVERLLVRLHAWLLGRQSGLSALRLVWHLDPRREVPLTGQLEIRTAQPSQDLRHVARLVSEHLAQQQLPAPVHSLTLVSLVTEYLNDAAAATGSLLMQARRQGDGIVELVERLSARLGDEQVQAWQAVADHRPERMQRWVPARSAIAAIQSAVAAPGQGARRRRKKSAAAAGVAGVSDVPRAEALLPSWLLPEPLRLKTVGDSPVWQGRLVRVSGIQRVETSSWLMTGEAKGDADSARQDPAVMRDYYIFRSEQGALLWIYGERLRTAVMQSPRRDWYLHGVFA